MTLRKNLNGRERRKARIKKKVMGTAARPRLAVFRSAKHIYAQIVDDEQGITLAAASTLTAGVKEEKGKKSDLAKAVGSAVAAECKKKNIEAVVFDRGGYRYHGRVKAVADAARESGLKF